MRVVRAAEGETREVTTTPIFKDGKVWSRSLASKDRPEGSDFSFAIVQFAAGARTVLHRHSSDQVLYVIAGVGKFSSLQGEQVISTGDFVLIPAQEDHWHGAADTGSPMSHIAITRSDSATTVTEPS
ncbi:MAG: cupin domain-containing protein [Chloroflexi bacterium]|nr:cupin domain-containing protein [Chloroflexota bacterium]